METIDKYDLLLATLGYSHSSITEMDLIQNQDEISRLAKELGIPIECGQFDLILTNDSFYDLLDVVITIHNLGLSNNKSLTVMNEARLHGESKIITGRYSRLKKMQDKLRNKNYKAFLKRVEK